MKRPTDPEAARIIDWLIVLFNHHREDRGYDVVDHAFTYIQRARREHGIPVTLSLADIFDSESPGWEQGPTLLEQRLPEFRS